MMTREEKLYTMTGTVLIQIADKLGVKVACNRTRTALKEAKAKVIARILEAEAATEIEEVETLEAPVTEEPVEVKVEEPKETKTKEKRTRKVKSVVSEEVINTFIDDFKDTVEECGLELKTWDKIKNLYAVKFNGKAVLECYVGRKNYRLNLKFEHLPEGVEAVTIKNYYLPACVKAIAYTDTLVFDIIKSFAE